MDIHVHPKSKQGKGGKTRSVVAILGPLLDRADEAAQVTLNGDDPEGPHQIRVGLRMLRTGMSVFGRGNRRAAEIRQEAREIAAVVGRLRDLDVVRQEIVAPFLDAHPGASGFEALDRALVQARVAAQAEVRAMLASGRLDRLLSKARKWAAKRGDRAARPLADRALRKRYRKARRFGRRFDRLDIEDRHAFRKELKKLRYTLDCGAWTKGRTARKRFLRALKALQNSLGAMNDAVVAEEVLMRVTFRADVAERAAAAQIKAALAARSAVEAARTAALWAELQDARPDWI